jgi:hypothetical protein
MEGKQEAIVAVENPFFMDAKIIDKKDYGDIVFFHTTLDRAARGEIYYCITSNGNIRLCYQDKKWGERMGLGGIFSANVKMTKGIVDILSFLFKEKILPIRNTQRSTGVDTHRTCLFITELIKKLDYTHQHAMKKKSKRRKSKRRKKTKRR